MLFKKLLYILSLKKDKNWNNNWPWTEEQLGTKWAFLSTMFDLALTRQTIIELLQSFAFADISIHTICYIVSSQCSKFLIKVQLICNLGRSKISNISDEKLQKKRFFVALFFPFLEHCVKQFFTQWCKLKWNVCVIFFPPFLKIRGNWFYIDQ